jgi:hypothetical protein
VVLLGFMVLLAAAGWTVAEYAQSAALERQREAEAELLWVGRQYRQAIESYYNATPAGVKQLPMKLEDLTEDKRFPTPRRHLRKVYTDPLKPGSALKVVKRGAFIAGVYSESNAEPFRKAGFEAGEESFSDAITLSDWRFVANARGLPASAGASASPNASAPAAGATPAPTAGSGTGR